MRDHQEERYYCMEKYEVFVEAIQWESKVCVEKMMLRGAGMRPAVYTLGVMALDFLFIVLQKNCL